MENDFSSGADPEEIKCFLRGVGLITLDEYYAKSKQMLKRQRHSSKMSYEQTQRKLFENNLFKDNLSKNLLCPRKRTAFSLVIPRKRGIKKKVIKECPPTSTTPTITPIITECAVSLTNSTNTVEYDQPLDLRLQSDRIICVATHIGDVNNNSLLHSLSKVQKKKKEEKKRTFDILFLTDFTLI
ncbi:unnamed protein product [Rotaria socialis]